MGIYGRVRQKKKGTVLLHGAMAQPFYELLPIRHYAYLYIYTAHPVPCHQHKKFISMYNGRAEPSLPAKFKTTICSGSCIRGIRSSEATTPSATTIPNSTPIRTTLLPGPWLPTPPETQSSPPSQPQACIIISNFRSSER